VTVIAHELRGFLSGGGMGTATTFLALALARMGHEVELLAGIGTPSSVDPHWASVYSRAGVRIRWAPGADEPVEPWQFVHPHSIALGLRDDPPDVVIAHDFGAPAYCALRLRQAGLAFQDSLFVVFCHGSRRYVLDFSPTVGLKDLPHVLAVGVLEQASVELADVVVSPSAYLVQWMREQGWRLPERTFVIPYFTPSAATGEAVATRARSGDEQRLRRLAFFGRLDEKKGLRQFAAGLNALGPDALDRLELEFVGKATASWPVDRVEGLLSERTRRALHAISFETGLDQHQALERLSRPGTLVVMPSLRENSPNTVYECLEHGIPFIASDVGGVAELIDPRDHGRVLFEPTAEGVAAAIKRVLAEPDGVRPARPAFSAAASSERWAEVIELRPQTSGRDVEGEIDVVVVERRSQASAHCRSALARQTHAGFQVTVAAIGADASSVEAARETALRAGSAPFVVFLDEEDVPEPELLSTLLRAQAASDADVVTCGVRLGTDDGNPTLRFFSGEPRGLGALSNDYGNVALFRRTVLEDLTTPWPAEADPDWPLLAGLATSGARIVSVPAPLVTRSRRPGSVEHDPSDALLVAERLERALPDPMRTTARLVAGLAANRDFAPAPPGRSVVQRARSAFRRLFAGTAVA
jgi:glycosyltransferase involved in cell wall biosynthesis